MNGNMVYMPKIKITAVLAPFFFAVLLFAACKKQEKPAAEAGTLRFTGHCAVYVWSPETLKEILAGSDEVEADDIVYYHFIAQEFLEKSGTKFTETEPGELVFVKNDGTSKIISEKECSICFVLFDGVKDPLMIHAAIDVPEVYKQYFSVEQVGG